MSRLHLRRLRLRAQTDAVLYGTDLSFERAILLAPVLVIGVAALAGLAVFWGKVGWKSVRVTRHPRLLVAGVVVVVALLTLLTVLGVKLPHE